MRLEEYFPPERLAGMADYMKRFAAQFGIERFEPRDRIPNTRRALALAEVARDEGKLDSYRTLAMEAHWRDGKDLENDDDLREIARSAALSHDAVERAKTDPQYLERVDDIREEASSIGVEGIPTFIIGNLALSGCQPYEVFEQFATEAGADRRA